MESVREGVKNVQFLRKFWGLVPRKRWAVVVAASQPLTVKGRYWTRKAAQQVKEELNAQERFSGFRRHLYRVREM